MPMGEAVETYSLLTVGDGLVSQIPALLLSVATGLIVTRSTADEDMGSDILRQIGRRRMPLQVAGAAAISLCLIPGLPKFPRLEEHTSELQSLMRISYAVFCLKKTQPQPNTSTLKNIDTIITRIHNAHS